MCVCVFCVCVCVCVFYWQVVLCDSSIQIGSIPNRAVVGLYRLMNLPYMESVCAMFLDLLIRGMVGE